VTTFTLKCSAASGKVFPLRRANGQQLAYLHFEDEPQRQMYMKRLWRDEAYRLAVNIAKLPSVPRQILKDIPRPPNTASRIQDPSTLRRSRLLKFSRRKPG
jgi:hypothetical protein